MSAILTFDLGTTLYKVALFDDTGKMLALERVKPPIQNPHPNQCELAVDQFLQTLDEAITKLRAAAGNAWSEIAGISYASQANSFTLLDERDRPLMPFMLWPDRRAVGTENHSESPQDFRLRTGIPRIGPLLTITKLKWLEENHPTLFHRARKVVFLNDYLTHHLTGRWLGEASVTGLSGLLDIQSLQPISRNGLLLDIRRSGTVVGPISTQLASKWGLNQNTKVVLGCLDQYAGAVGTGTVSAGKLCETTGTVLAAVRCSTEVSDALPPDVFQGPSYAPNLYYQMSFSNTSAVILEFFQKAMTEEFFPNMQQLSFEELSRLAGEATRAAIIHPYNRSMNDVFRDVSKTDTPGEIVRGIMQCVAKALHNQVQSLGGATGAIRAAGGASKSDVWLQIKANELQTSLEAMECPEPTSLGAAILAGAGLGWGSVPELANRWIKTRRRFNPA